MFKANRMYTRRIAFAGVTAALYAVLTLALNLLGMAYGPIQFRFSEALCILPFFFPFSAWGLFIGCIIANLFSPYALDIVVGPAATLLAAICTMQIGRKAGSGLVSKALACAPPVIFNAVFIGALIAYSMAGAGGADAFIPAFVTNSLWVGFWQLLVLYSIGLPLLVYLPKSRVYDRLLKYYGL